LKIFISQGRFFEARSRAEGAQKNSDHPRVKQLLALSISKLGMPELTLETMEQVYWQSPDDPESMAVRQVRLEKLPIRLLPWWRNFRLGFGK
jgi:hypothetical protein